MDGRAAPDPAGPGPDCLTHLANPGAACASWRNWPRWTPSPACAPPPTFQAILGSAELAHAMRTGRPFTLLELELDGLDVIREGFGVDAADRLARDGPASGPSGTPGRCAGAPGAERFGVLMRHGGHEAAEGLARRVTQAVAAPLVLHSGDEVGVGISVGMAAFSDAANPCANCSPKRPQRWAKPGRATPDAAMFAVTH